MNHKIASIWTLVLVALLGTAGGARAFECLGTESAEGCFARGLGVLKPAEEKQRKDAVRKEAKKEGDESKEELRLIPTGIDTGGTALETNTKNFLPLIAMSGLLGEPEKDDAKGTYTFDLNFLISRLAKDKNAQLQAVANSRPEVSKALSDQLPADGRDAAVEKLKQGLGDLDDYLLTFTYSPMGRRIGRAFEQHRNHFEALVWAARDSFLQIPPQQNALIALGEEARRIEGPLRQADRPAAHRLAEEDQLFLMGFDKIEKIDPAAATSLQRATEAAVDQEARRLEHDRQVLIDVGLDDPDLEIFRSLIDNQPQLDVSIQQRLRDPVVGGDETALKVTYARALADLNHALGKDDCLAALDQPVPESIDPVKRVACLGHYKEFVNANRKKIEDGTKFSFSGEYVDIGKESINRPDLGVTGIDLKGSTKLIISAGYTRLFPALGSEAQPLRLDLVASYEDVSDDPTKNDRGMATLTVTRKVGNLSVPFGIVYANHGEFLGDVDQKLSAHVGLKFDLFGKK